MSVRFDFGKFSAAMEAEHPGFAATWDFATTHLSPLESPLEVEFLANWILVTYLPNSCSYADALPPGRNSQRIFDLRSQRVLGNFRADFSLDVLSDDGVKLATAIIETDGFTFHGDRKAFENDRARDQFFLSRGMVCFRFTHRSLRRENPLAHLIGWTRQLRPIGAGALTTAEQQSAEGETPFELVGFGRALVASHIKDAATDPAEMKSRVMTAWEHGQLGAEDAEEWIVLWGLESA